MEKLLLLSRAHLSALPNNRRRHGWAFGCKSCEIKGLRFSLGVTRHFFHHPLEMLELLAKSGPKLTSHILCLLPKHYL